MQGARGRAWVEAHADRRRSVDAFAAGYREARGRAMRPRGRFAGRTALLAAGTRRSPRDSSRSSSHCGARCPLPGTLGTLPAPNVPLDAPWLGGVALVDARGPLARGDLRRAARVAQGAGRPPRRRRSWRAASSSRSTSSRAARCRARCSSSGCRSSRSRSGSGGGSRRRSAPIGMRPVLVLGAGEDARRAADALASGRITGHTLLEWREDAERFEAGGRATSSSRPTGRRTAARS